MKIAGFQKFSLIDYPGKISAIIFTQGCNFRCPYCHNPELVDPKLFTEPLDEDLILSFLKKRVGKLDGVVITGGEPLLQPDLAEFIKKVREMGYLVKLDTNGSYPEILKDLLSKNLITYIAMDIKAPLEKYQEVVRADISPEKIQESITIVLNSNIDYEFRTTVVKNLLTEKDLISVAKLIKGAKRYVLQKFVASKILDRSFARKAESFSEEELNAVKEKAKKYVSECIVR
ncbi:anaerobic ribonucleoside-triphosphate reductase activating protein [bacterium]|nr:anaerobic ribonucleoside-triphosphate reductase activating protein [bacterium]